MSPKSMRREILAAALTGLLVFLPTPVSATWSVIAVDRSTGRLVIASATCVPQGRLLTFPADDLRDIQAIVVPGVGVAAAQAGVDRDRSNQELIFRQIQRGTHPSRILEMLVSDPEIQVRQFGIVDLEGRFAGFSGADNSHASVDVQGRVPETEIYYSIQGNILASYFVVQEAVKAMEETEGSVTDKVMAAMEAADRAGGDARCSCEDESTPDAPCEFRTSDVAYIMAADPDDEAYTELGFNDGAYFYISVTDENTRPDENANPVITLRMRYDARMGGEIPDP